VTGVTIGSVAQSAKPAGPVRPGGAALTIAILTIVSPFELAVSVVYTANPLSGAGVSIDIEYLPTRIPRLSGQD
jgi:hypothetical protein